MSGGHAPVPARAVVTGRRTGSFTGYHPSRKMKALVAFESLLEADALTLLEVDVAVVSYETQPLTLRWRDGAMRRRRYTPDLLVTTGHGLTYREVKPGRRYLRDPSLGGRRDRIEAECAALGANFEVWTDADIRREPRLSNARAILAEGRRVGDAWAEARARVLLPACATVGELARAAGLPPSRALRAVMRLAALGEAGIDVEAPLGPATRIQGGRGR